MEKVTNFLICVIMRPVLRYKTCVGPYLVCDSSSRTTNTSGSLERTGSGSSPRSEMRLHRPLYILEGGEEPTGTRGFQETLTGPIMITIVIVTDDEGK